MNFAHDHTGGIACQPDPSSERMERLMEKAAKQRRAKYPCPGFAPMEWGRKGYCQCEESGDWTTFKSPMLLGYTLYFFWDFYLEAISKPDAAKPLTFLEWRQIRDEKLQVELKRMATHIPAHVFDHAKLDMNADCVFIYRVKLHCCEMETICLLNMTEIDARSEKIFTAKYEATLRRISEEAGRTPIAGGSVDAQPINPSMDEQVSLGQQLNDDQAAASATPGTGSDPHLTLGPASSEVEPHEQPSSSDTEGDEIATPLIQSMAQFEDNPNLGNTVDSSPRRSARIASVARFQPSSSSAEEEQSDNPAVGGSGTASSAEPASRTRQDKGKKRKRDVAASDDDE